MPHRIDVHHHPSRAVDLQARGGQMVARERLSWSIERSLEMMEAGDVAVSILSLPGAVSFSGPAGQDGAASAREANEFLATLVRDHPGRFGMFAALPILDIDASLRELEYGLDILHADGIGLTTNCGERWLGDPHYWPVFEELNRRRAVVYTHPTAPTCTAGIYEEFNDSVIELCTDTARAIAKLIFSGAAARFPNIRFIMSHGGGTMPILVERFERAHRYAKVDLAGRMPHGVLFELKKLHYECAQAAHIWAVAPLVKLVATSQILFGTDYPYRTAQEMAGMLVETGCFTPEQLRAIDCENAWRLFPRWRPA